MRLLGAIMIVSAMSMIGILKYAEYKKCCNVLREITAMLELMKSEICTYHAPINLVFDRVYSGFDGEISDFAKELMASLDSLGDREFSELWADAALKTLDCIPPDCMKELKLLGTSIGRYNAEIQCEALDRCAAFFVKKHNEWQLQLKAKEKTYIGLYSGAGLIAAIAMI